MSDHKADYTKDDLLALYTFTGGVPKYIEQFMDNGCTSMENMVDFMLQPDSSFLTEGQALLIQEFGKKYGNYFSILSAISNGKNTLPEMETVMGGMSLGGQLKRLEEDYDLIKKNGLYSQKRVPRQSVMKYRICFYVSGSGILSSIKII